jgi:hypothetical protein
VKINLDDALDMDRNIAVSGIVARDITGFQRAMGKPYNGNVEPFTAEALAPRDVFVCKWVLRVWFLR